MWLEDQQDAPSNTPTEDIVALVLLKLLESQDEKEDDR